MGRTDVSLDHAWGLWSACVKCGELRWSFLDADPAWFLGEVDGPGVMGFFPRCSHWRMISLVVNSGDVSSLSSSRISSGTWKS